eukprot:22456-Hanusia_phi.AAC.6
MLRTRYVSCPQGWNLLLAIFICLPRIHGQATGYPGYWFYGSEYTTTLKGETGILSQFNESLAPCRFDGEICVRSVWIMSDPGEFQHNTGRSICVETVSMSSCTTRMKDYGYSQRIDPLRPYGLYPNTDGPSTTTFVSGLNFHGELGLGDRVPIRYPTLQKYFKIGDGLYNQPVGGGRGFKNLSLVNFGFSHGFGMDSQGVLYAWGSNEYGQLGLQNNEFPTGSRYHALWPQPLIFFRPLQVFVCTGGVNQFLPCSGQGDKTTCIESNSYCLPGTNPVAPRRNAFSASKQTLSAAHSAVLTDYLPRGCFRYDIIMDSSAIATAATSTCTTDAKLFVWGYNLYGQIGLGANNPIFYLLPQQVSPPPGEKWYSVACGGLHTIASTVSGKLYTWGINNIGQLGLTEEDMLSRCQGPSRQCCDGYCSAPQLISGACTTSTDCLTGRRIIHVTAGQQFSAALDVEGIVWLFGDNQYGQLCQGQRAGSLGGISIPNFVTSYQPVRARMPSDVFVVDVIAGFFHVTAISADGGLFLWGRNNRGQLGRGHVKDDSCHLEVRGGVTLGRRRNAEREMR